jgi:hypothetical protein
MQTAQRINTKTLGIQGDRVDNLKNGFLWGLGFGLSITIIILITQYVNPSEYEKMQSYNPTKIESFEVTSKVSRLEGSNYVVAGEYKITQMTNFEMYKIEVVLRDEKGVFLQRCSSDVDKYNIETEKTFTKVVVCRDFSDSSSVSSIEISLMGYK